MIPGQVLCSFGWGTLDLGLRPELRELGQGVGGILSEATAFSGGGSENPGNQKPLLLMKPSKGLAVTGHARPPLSEAPLEVGRPMPGQEVRGPACGPTNSSGPEGRPMHGCKSEDSWAKGGSAERSYGCWLSRGNRGGPGMGEKGARASAALAPHRAHAHMERRSLASCHSPLGNVLVPSPLSRSSSA